MATMLYAMYHESSELRIQGNFQNVRPYLKQGYRKIREDNGNWILSKPANLEIAFEENNKIYKYNMRKEICDYFKKTRISRKIADDFVECITSGIIMVDIDENGFCTIK